MAISNPLFLWIKAALPNLMPSRSVQLMFSASMCESGMGPFTAPTSPPATRLSRFKASFPPPLNLLQPLSTANDSLALRPTSFVPDHSPKHCLTWAFCCKGQINPHPIRWWAETMVLQGKCKSGDGRDNHRGCGAVGQHAMHIFF